MKPNWQPVTYYPELDSMDGTHVRFVGMKDTPEQFELCLPRTAWYDMGRPGKVAYEVTPYITGSFVTARSNAVPEETK